ncbi:unnamed protein product [Lymnaea stagnalis]|uniref:Uncharacterized protein n=1 Tax=Lymnaea stagnalis TaxID=6523 RepID=A0AAV2IJ23_LYMST
MDAPSNGAKLITAVERGDLESIQSMIDSGVDINTTNNNGETVLLLAARSGNIDVIRLLCQNKANVNKKSVLGDTPLMVAAGEGRLDIVEEFCLRSAHVNATNLKGLSPLMWLDKGAVFEIAQLLIDKYRADVNHTNTDGESVLIRAVNEGFVGVVKVLVEKGACVDYSTKSGWNALLRATKKGNVEIVSFLLQNNANVNQKTKDAWTALNLACFKNYSSIAETLIRHHADVNIVNSKGFSPLMCACNNRDLRIVKLLIDHGANKNKITNDGMKALELANLAEDEEVEYLLTFDGDNNKLLMQTARDEGKVNIFKMLLDFGIDVNITSKNKTSVLMTACKAGNLKVVQLLLSRDDVMIDAVNNHGWNALMMASHGGHLAIVSELLKKGAEINKGNKLENSALLMATARGHIDIVERLLQSGADVNHMNQDRWTAAMLASQNGTLDIVKILMLNNADVDIVNSDGKTAAMLASENGFNNILNCLSDRCRGGSGVENGISVGTKGILDIQKIDKKEDDTDETLNKRLIVNNLEHSEGAVSINGQAINIDGQGVALIPQVAHHAHFNVAAGVLPAVVQQLVTGVSQMQIASQSGTIISHPHIVNVFVLHQSNSVTNNFTNVVQEKEQINTVKGKSEKMKPEDEDKIRKNWEFLIEHLDARDIAAAMFEGDIFDLSDKREIAELECSKKRNEILLSKLLNAGPGPAFQTFLTVLERDHSFIAQRLTENVSCPPLTSSVT